MPKVFINSFLRKTFMVTRGLALSPYVTGVMLDGIDVPLLTSLSTVKSDYLPDEIDVDLSNGSTLTISVTWDDLDYDPNTLGEYVFIAEYELPETVWPITPTITITITLKPIATTFDSISNIDSYYGTEENALSHPTEATLNFNDGTSGLITINSWEPQTSYDPEQHGEQTFISTDYDLPAGIIGDKPIASYNVNITPIILGVTQPSQLYAKYGTELGDLDLPDEVTLNISDGDVDVGVSWENTLYHETTPDDYTFVGTYSLPVGVGLIGDLPIVEIIVTLMEPAQLIIQADNKSKVYNKSGSDPALTYTILEGELEPGDTLSGSLVRASGVNVGTYTISQGTLDNPLYNITFINGTFTITKRDLTIMSFSAGDKVYDGTTSALVGFVDNRIPGDFVSFSYSRSFDNKNVGTDKTVNITSITISGGTHGANYNLVTTSGTATASITAAPLDITADDKSKSYDGDVFPVGSYTVTYDGFVASEGTGVLGGSLTFSGSAIEATEIGTYTITPGGLTSSNYNITFNNGTLTIE